MRHRERAGLDYSRLRWYRDVTTTYRLTTDYIVPYALRPLTQVTVTGLEHVPVTGPVILAANHRDNLDAFLLAHLVPRFVHFAARRDGFGTGALCAIWRRLGAFPADAWGIRHALNLLADGGAVALFPQGTISIDLGTRCGAAGLLALHSGAPVVPIGIRGTDTVHLHSLFVGREAIQVRFGPPVSFTRGGSSSPHSREVTREILQHIHALLEDER
jgi:1-acyl-sn-glycerol-3-phosphate acyltransferase